MLRELLKILKLSVILFVLISCGNERTFPNKQSPTNFLELDSVTLADIGVFLDTVRSSLIDSSSFLDFKLGKSKQDVLAILNEYVHEKKFSIGRESYDTSVHYYYRLPTNILRKGKRVDLIADVSFLFENALLTQVSLSLFAPGDLVPEKLRTKNSYRSLDELEQLLTKKAQDNSSYDVELENIALIGRNYAARLYNDLASLYKARYGKAIIIKTDEVLDQSLNQNSYYDKYWMQEASLLWMPNGKWICFDYVGAISISKQYYFSSTNTNKIYIGTIYYTSVASMVGRHKTNLTDNLQYNNLDSANLQSHQKESYAQKK